MTKWETMNVTPITVMSCRT